MISLSDLLDGLARQAGFRHTRARALTLGCCVRCGRDVNVAALSERDFLEYTKGSALCPQCWDAVFPPEDDDCAD